MGHLLLSPAALHGVQAEPRTTLADPLSPARGVLLGVVLSLLCWSTLALLLRLLWQAG